MDRSVITFIAMGTVNTVTLFGPANNDVKIAVFQLVKTLEDKFTVNRPHSEVMSVNDSAGVSPVRVSDEVFELIRRAVDAGLQPNSGFNPLIGSLTRLWKQSLSDGILPSRAQISVALNRINPHDVLFNDAQRTVFLTRTGMSMDLGAVAKGYIADRLQQLLARHRIYSGIIDLGGNVMTVGESPNHPQGQWRVGIQLPFAERGRYVGIVAVKNKSVVTSGNYEKYTEIDGKQYHHIIDPHTGYPFESRLDSITIISDDSTEGEILSTQLYFKGLEESLKFLENRPHFSAVFITRDKKIYLSKNLLNSFKLVNSDYQLIT